MHTKKSWVFLSVNLLMISSLLITSCSNNKDETWNAGDYADPTEPKYGGIHNRIRLEDWNTWDYAAQTNNAMSALMGEELLGGDWTKGPAGTNENDWTSGYGGFADTLTGRLAESWEMPDSETIIYHIRPGIHWWDKEPANGRELTADDVAWNIMRHFSSSKSYNYVKYTQAGITPLSITLTDAYTVEVEVEPEYQGELATVIGDQLWLLCPDAVEANGDEPLTDWEQFIGTGPFIIESYAPNSSIEYVKNPDYWQTDPLHPDNQLPYADGIKEIIISQASSLSGASLLKATFETGKADIISTTSMTFLGYEELDLLKEKHPELNMKSFPGSVSFMIWPWLENKDLPFSDIRIRQAMNMAVNQQELVEDFYDGHAELLSWPYPNWTVYDRIYTPLEEQSQMVRDMFGYDIEQAKQLLTEAGYPEGFTFTVDCFAVHSDFVSIIKNYLEEINIIMEIGVLNSVDPVFHGEAYYGASLFSNPLDICLVEGSPYNYSQYSDSLLEEAYKEIAGNLGTNDTEVARILKKLGSYQLNLAIPVYLPSPHQIVMWWPWFQNYFGAVGGGGNDNIDEYLMYFWIDTGMKEVMGY